MGQARIGRIRMKNGGADIRILHPDSVGDGYRVHPTKICDAARNEPFLNMVLIGELPDDDELYITAMGNVGVSLILLERAKLQLIE